MQRIILFAFVSICFCLPSLFAENHFVLDKETEEFSELAENHPQRYVLVDLGVIPTKQQREALKEKGIYLLRYVSGTKYYALVEERAEVQRRASRTEDFSIETQEIENNSKLGPFLKSEDIPDYAKVGEGVIRVIIAYFPKVEHSDIKEYIQMKKMKNVLVLKEFNMFNADITLDLIPDLIAQPWLRKVECIPPPYEFENIEARTMNRTSLLAYKGIGGRGLEGEGVKVGLWDGNVEAHPDLGNRLITKEFTKPSEHGQHVSGTMLGAGLIDAKARGMAPKSILYAWNFTNGNTALEMLKSAKDYEVVVTQNSYGVSQKYYCKTPKQYDLNDEQLDLIANYFPKLTHVFSAGNDQYRCTGKSSYASSTKRAKNIILVGASDKLCKMSDFSSWGPMDDGRILPHIVTNGVDVYSTVYNNTYESEGWQGTSMATPAISGLVSLLYERYRQLNDNNNPLSALVKGALLNTAKDLGNKGPDYQYGFGAADGEKAMTLLENKQYFVGKISHGQTINHHITVPKDAVELNIMLVWTDKEGKTTEKALINDLDLKVSSGTTDFFPWILDPEQPHLPATNGIDRLNNQEQVTIQNPQNAYEIHIKGARIPEAEQEYVVVYSYKTPELRVVYPNGGEIFQPGDKIVARWNSVGYAGNQSLQLSTDGGVTFSSLDEKIAEGTQDVIVTIPKVQTAKAILRVTQAGTVDKSDHAFSILSSPQNLKLTPSGCSSSGWKISWDAVAGAVSYKILKAKVAEGIFMEIGESETLSFDLPKLTADEKNIYSVKAVTAEGAMSGRAYAIIANSSGSVPVTATNLPFNEEFAETPSRFVEVENGANVTVGYEQLAATASEPSKKGHFLVFNGSDETKSWDSANVYSNTPNVANAKFCNIDATKIQGQLWMRFALLMKNSEKGNANMRLLVDGSPVKNTYGETSITSVEKGKMVKYYNLSDKAGTEFSVNFQAAVRNRKDSVMLTFIQIFEAKNDVGLLSLTVPDPAESLSATEAIKIKVKNYNGVSIADIPVQLYVDGQMIAEEVIAGPIEPFKSIDYSFNKKADLSTPDKLYEIKAIVAFDGDVNTANNSLVKTAANLGDYYRIPEIVSFYPKEKKVNTNVLRFTDDGARLLNYSDNLRSGVVFAPTTSGQRVKLKFTEFHTDSKYDKVTIYDGAYSSSRVLAVLSGKVDTPIEYISSDHSKKLLVEFETNSSGNAKGWMAEVTETSESPNNSAVNNVYTVSGISNKDGYFATPQTIVMDIKNNTAAAVKNVQVQYRINEGAWSDTETIASIGAGQLINYSFTKKADITESPKRYLIEVRVLSDDVYKKDNTASVMVTNDHYCVSNSGFSANHNLLFITKVSIGNIQNVTSSKTSGSPKPQYFRNIKFPVYKDKTDNFLEVSVNENASTGKIGLWVDWNNDFDFEDTGEKLGEVLITRGQKKYTIPIVYPSDIAAGDYNARLRVSTGSLTDVCQSDTYGKNGEVEDYTISIVEKYPYPSDLAMISTTLKGGENLANAEDITVLIANKGTQEINGFEVAYAINGGTEVKEKVNTALGANATMTYTFKTKADLSHVGEYKVHLYTILASDNNLTNNSIYKSVINQVIAEDGFFALNFDGKDDVVNFGTLGDTNIQSFTYEAWINPASYGGYGEIGFGRVFEGKGATIFLAAEGHSFYPANSLIVGGVGGGTFHTEKQSIQLNQWQHLAVTLDHTTKSLRVYINGEMVNIKEYKPIGSFTNNSLSKLFIGNRRDGKRAFKGMIDEARIWTVARTQEDIKAAMYSHQKGAADLLAEFSFDEGYFNHKVYGGAYLGVVENAEIKDVAGSIWIAPTKLLKEIKVSGQVIDWIVDGYKMKSEVLESTDLSKILADFKTTWPNTKVEVEGKSQISKTTINDFTNSEKKPVAYDFSTTVFGKKITESYLLTLSQEKSVACELLTFEIPSLSISAKTITQQMNFTIPEDASRKSLITKFTVSEGAKVFVDNVEIVSAVAIDYTKPVVLKVVAANGRANKEYSVALQKKQFIAWTPTTVELTKVYGDAAFTLNGTTSSANQIYYTSADNSIISIVRNQAQIKGAGEVVIVANIPEDNNTLAASSVSHTFTVNKKALIITAEDKEVNYLDPIPELTMTFSGFVYGEDKSLLKELPTITTLAKQGIAAGTYSITLAGGVDDNYKYLLKAGTLTIKSTNVQEVTFNVNFEGAVEQGAMIAIDGREILTNANGKAIVELNPGTYTYTITKEGRESYLGTITVADAPQIVNVKMTNVLPRYTVNYIAGENGMIEGISLQRIKKGANGTKVTAKPKFGYQFDHWSDGSKSPTHIATNVQKNETFTATFIPKNYTLSYSTGVGGVLSGVSLQTVAFGGSGTAVKAVAKEGYSFLKWSDGVTDNPRTDTNISMDIAVVAKYSKTYKLPYNQDFTGANLPEDWNSTDHAGDGIVWKFIDKIAYGTTLNGATPNFAGVESLKGKKANADLISPVFDCSANSSVTLSFKHYFNTLSNSYGVLAYSIAGGDWVEIKKWSADTKNAENYTVTITEVAGKANVRFLWRYVSPNWEYYWLVDDINIKGELAADEYTVTYRAGENGVLEGSGDVVSATVANGAMGPLVKAVANEGYVFKKWSDGVTDNPRQDKITAAIDVTAVFMSDCVPIARFPYLEDFNQKKAALPDCWEAPLNNNTNSWSVGVGKSIGTVGNTIYFDGYKASFSKEESADLLSPVFDFTNQTEVYLLFKHTFVKFIGAPKATLSYTLDNGANWIEIKSWTNSTKLPEFFNQDISAQVKGKPNVRFKWNYYGKYGYGWSVDDVELRTKPSYALYYYVPETKNAQGKDIFKGSIVGDFTQTVNKGSNGTEVRAKPIPKYAFVKWSDGRTDNPRVDTDVAGNVIVAAEFEKVEFETYTLTYIAGTHGTISGTTTQSVKEDSDGTAVTAIPKDGYKFANWSDGRTDNPRIDKAIVGNITVAAKFIADVAVTYTLPYNQSFENNTIPENWEVKDNAADGCNWEFKAVGGSFYKVSLAGSKANHAYMDSYGCGYGKKTNAELISPVFDMSANASVTLKFNHHYRRGFNAKEAALLLYSVDGGTTWIELAAFTATNKNSTAFKKTVDEVAGKSKVRFKWILKNAYYYWIVDDVEILEPTNEKSYVITYTWSSGGTVSGTTSQTITHGGSSTEVEAIADTGYHFVKWSDGRTENPRRDMNIVKDISVEAIFAINTYSVVYTSTAHGTVSGTTFQTVTHGGSATQVEAIADTGYHFVKWSDGRTENPRRDMNIVKDISVEAIFAINTYSVVYTSTAHGTVSGTTSQTITHGGSATQVEAIADPGYHFIKWSDARTDNPRRDMNIVKDISVKAVFIKNILIPKANDDNVFAAMHERELTLNVIENDYNIEDNYSVKIVKEPVHGKVFMNNDGFVRYIPNIGFEGTDIFTYRICNEGTVCDEAKVKIQIHKAKYFEYIEAAQILTPNGDGVNDEWCIPELRKQVLNAVGNFVKIFNEKGELVYDKSDYMLDGDCFSGHAKGASSYADGEALPEGLYFFVIEVESGFREKGFLYIVKDK